MSEPLQNQNPCGNTKGKSEELENNASNSNPKKGGCQRKYVRPGEAGSKYFVFSDQGNNNNNQNPPPPPPVLDRVVAATGPGSNVDVTVGQNFTGVIDGIFSGGYLLSIKIGNSNGPILKGVVFNPESQVSAEIDQGEEEEEEEEEEDEEEEEEDS